MNHWLLKTEPASFSLDDLKREKTTSWDGVRNYQARNFLRAMKPGDLVFIHHSGIALPAVAGVGEIVGKELPDPSQFDQRSPYYDPASNRESPRWTTRRVRYKETFKNPVTLAAIKRDPQLFGMMVAQKGIRLSVQPVSKSHFDRILKLGRG